MEPVAKAAVIALVGVVCCLLIKKYNPELSFVIAICTSLIIGIYSLRLLTEFKEYVYEIINISGLSATVFSPIIKCVGISVIVSITSGLCKDAGQSSAASALEYFGTAAGLFVALPLLHSMLEALRNIL